MASWAGAPRFLWQRRLPAMFAPGAGLLATLITSDALTARGHPSAALGLAVMGGVVGLVGWCSPWLPALATGGIGWLMLDGFVVDSYGALRWHGIADALRLAVLLGAGLALCGARTGLRYLVRLVQALSTAAEQADQFADRRGAPIHQVRGERGT